MKNASLAAILATTGAFALLVPVSAFAQAAPAPATDSAPVAASAPSDQAPTPAAVAPAPAPEPLPWAGTSLYTTIATPTSNVFRGQNQSVDAAANYFIRLAPRWTFNKDWQLRGIIGGSVDVVEGINTGSTYTREFLVNDPSFTLFYTGIPKLPGGIRMLAGASLRLPLSKASWSQTLIASPGIAMQFAKPFESLGGDTLALVSIAYQHPFYLQTTPTTSDSLPYPRATFGGLGVNGVTDDQISGAGNTRDQFNVLAFLVQSWGHWSPGVFAFVSNAYPYNFRDLGLRQDNVSTFRARSASFFGAFLDYEVNAWLTPEVGYQMFRSALDADGTYGNPLWGRYQDMQIYVGANIQIDSLYKALRGDSGEAGVVRAARKPIAFAF